VGSGFWLGHIQLHTKRVPGSSTFNVIHWHWQHSKWSKPSGKFSILFVDNYQTK